MRGNGRFYSLSGWLPAQQLRKDQFDLLKCKTRHPSFRVQTAVTDDQDIIAVDQRKFRRKPHAAISRLSSDHSHRASSPTSIEEPDVNAMHDFTSDLIQVIQPAGFRSVYVVITPEP